MKSLKSRHSSQAGVGIIELLVALAVSMILAGGIYQIFVGSTTSYSLNEDLSRLQENGRFAMNVLRSEVRGAGYLGCLQDVSSLKNTLNNPDDFVFDFSNAIYGLEADGVKWKDNDGEVNPTLTGASNLSLTDPVTGSDILVVRGIRSDVMTIELTDGMPIPSADLKVTSGIPDTILNPGGGDILLITDCQAAAIFQTTGYTFDNGNMVHNTGGSVSPGNAEKDLGHEFVKGAQIFFPQTVVFYVRNNPAGQPSLYRKVGLSAVEELVEGVENMQVRYGVDTDGDRSVDAYVTADDVDDWNEVLSVRIGLLVRTIDEIAKGPVDDRTYDVDADGVAEYDPPDDRRMRLVVGGTIGLRNRLR